MSIQEISLTPLIKEDPVAGLNRVLPGMESIVPRLGEGEILNRFQTLIAAVFLLTQPDLAEFYFKSMHLEYPTYDQIEGLKKDHPILSIHLLTDAMAFATRNGATGHIILDVFSRQFEKNAFNWATFHPKVLNESSTNFRSRSAANYSYIRPNYIYDEVRPVRPSINLLKVLKGVRHLSPDLVSDGFPYTPYEILRRHDHRKMLSFELKSGEKLLFFKLSFPFGVFWRPGSGKLRCFCIQTFLLQFICNPVHPSIF